MLEITLCVLALPVVLELPGQGTNSSLCSKSNEDGLNYMYTEQ